MSCGSCCGAGSAQVLPEERDGVPIIVAPPLAAEEVSRSYEDVTTGALQDHNALRARIQAAGIEPELRPRMWRRLLGVVPWGATRDEEALKLNAMR